MKKALTFCLILALVLSLAPPLSALAANTPPLPLMFSSLSSADPDDPQQPEPYDDEDADPGASDCMCGPDCTCKQDDYDYYRPYSSLKLWERFGFETPEEFMEYYVDSVISYEFDYISIDEPFWAVFDGYYSSQQYFMQRYNLNDEEYQRLETAWAAYREILMQRLTDELVTLGGTAGIVNVMINGEFLKFSSAIPELTDGVTYVPARAYFEALGASVSYNGQDGAVTAKFEDYSLRLTIGEEMMLLSDKDGDELLHIEHAPYIRNGVTYIPVRAVADDMGLTVYWDNRFKSVVIIDIAALIEKIDKDFTIINRMYSPLQGDNSNAGGLSKSNIDILERMTEMNSLDGDTVINFGAGISYITDGRNYNIKAKVDLADMLGILIDEYRMTDDYYYDRYGDDYVPYDEELIAQLESLRDADDDLLEADLILNFEEDTLYIRAPYISEAFPELGLQADAWLSVSGISVVLNILELSGVIDDFIYNEVGYFESMNGPSMGTSIVEPYISYAYSYYSYYSYFSRNQIRFYNEIMDIAGYHKALYGDDNFIKNGNEYKLSLTLEDMRAAAEEYGQYTGYTRFNYDLTITTDGDETTSVHGKTVYRTGYSSYYQTQYTREFELTPGHSRYSDETHVMNEAITRIDIDISTEPTSEPLRLAPPEGAVVVPIDDLIPEEYYDDYYYNPINPVRYIAETMKDRDWS